MNNFSNISTQPFTQGVPQLNQQITFQQPTFFPQSIGNVYNLSTATDIGNIPASTNLSVGLCLAENILYIKSLQNGAPMILSYRISPLEGPAAPANTMSDTKTNQSVSDIMKEYDERIVALKKEIAEIKSRLGGKLEWQV